MVCGSFLYGAFTTSHAGLAQLYFFGGLAGISIVHLWLFHTLLSLSLSDIILTNKKILYVTRSLWFTDMSHDIALNRIKAVEGHREGFLQNIFNYGELWFDTGGSSKKDPHQSIRYAPRPQQWANEIIAAMRKE